MHVYLIAMNVWGFLQLLGIALMLRDGDKQSGASLVTSVLSLGLSLWAFALLVQGY